MGAAVLLEELVTQMINDRPLNVLEFIEKWAHAKQFGDEGDAGHSDPQLVVRDSWRAWIRAEGKQEEVARRFFEFLFLQRPVLKSTVFENFALDEAVTTFAEMLDHLFGEEEGISDSQMVGIATEIAVGRGIKPRYFPTFLSAMHAAVSLTIGNERWGPINNGWNKELTSLMYRVQAAVHAAEHDGETLSDHENESAKMKAGELWSAIGADEEKSLTSKALDVLFTQHESLRQTLFAGVDIDQFVAAAAPLLSRAIRGQLSPSAIEESGFIRAAMMKEVKPKHLDYAITAILSTLQSFFGEEKWVATSSQWSEILRSAANDLLHILDVTVAADSKTTC